MYKNYLYNSIICFVAFLVVGCSTNQQEFPMPQSIKDQIRSSELLIEKPADNITGEIDRSNITGAMGGGLLFALIDAAVDSSRQSQMQEDMTPLQKRYSMYDASAKFISRAESTLKKFDWLKINRVKAEKTQDNPLNEFVERHVKTASGDMLIHCSLDYRLTSQFTDLKGIMMVTFTPVSKELKKSLSEFNSQFTDNEKYPLLWAIKVEANEPLFEMGDSREQNSNIWLKDNGQHLHDSIDKINNNLFNELEKKLKSPHIFADTDKVKK